MTLSGCEPWDTHTHTHTHTHAHNRIYFNNSTSLSLSLTAFCQMSPGCSHVEVVSTFQKSLLHESSGSQFGCHGSPKGCYMVQMIGEWRKHFSAEHNGFIKRSCSKGWQPVHLNVTWMRRLPVKPDLLYLYFLYITKTHKVKTIPEKGVFWPVFELHLCPRNFRNSWSWKIAPHKTQSSTQCAEHEDGICWRSVNGHLASCVTSVHQRRLMHYWTVGVGDLKLPALQYTHWSICMNTFWNGWVCASSTPDCDLRLSHLNH